MPIHAERGFSCRHCSVFDHNLNKAQSMAKLLNLNTYHYRRGGADAVYFDHIELFEGIGWQTAAMAMSHPKNEPSPWDQYFVDELEFGSEYGVLQKISMAGKIIYSLEAKNKVEKLIDDWQPDVAHAHNLYHHISPSVLTVLKKKNIPTVLTAHDFKLACPAYKMFNNSGICERCKGGNLSHVILNRCVRDSLMISSLVAVESTIHRLFGLYKNSLDKIVVPSRFLFNKLVEWGWAEEKLAYIANFVHIEQYQPNYQPGDYFVFFGRLAKEKGVDRLLMAGAKAGVKLKILGTGPLEQELKDFAGLEQVDVEFLGYRSGDELKTIIAESRAVVLPAQWYENAPISIMEAFALGKIVIGSNLGGIPEMIEDSHTGYLFDHDDEQQLVSVLSRVSQMPDSQLISMGKTAREHVSQHFTSANYLAKMLALYQQLGVVDESSLATSGINQQHA